MKDHSLQTRFAITVFGIACFAHSGCVRSNLDNAFDPQFPLGLAIGLSLLSTSAAGSSSTICDSVLYSSYVNGTY